MNANGPKDSVVQPNEYPMKLWDMGLWRRLLRSPFLLFEIRGTKVMNNEATNDLRFNDLMMKTGHSDDSPRPSFLGRLRNNGVSELATLVAAEMRSPSLLPPLSFIKNSLRYCRPFYLVILLEDFRRERHQT